MIQVLRLEKYHPLSVNTLLSTHPKRRSKLKNAEYDIVWGECDRQRLIKATGKRRVSYRFEGWPRGGVADPQNLLKVLEDALVHAGMLINDSPDYYQLGEVMLYREEWRTTITLEDLYEHTA